MLFKAFLPALFLAEEWSLGHSYNLGQEVCGEMGSEEHTSVLSQKITSLSRSNSSSSSKHDSQKVTVRVCVCVMGGGAWPHTFHPSIFFTCLSSFG